MNLAKQADHVNIDDARRNLYGMLKKMDRRTKRPEESSGEVQMPLIKKFLTECYPHADGTEGSVLTSWVARQTGPMSLAITAAGCLDMRTPVLSGKTAAISKAESSAGLAAAHKSLKRRIETPGGTNNKKLKRLVKGVEKNIADPDHPGKTASFAAQAPGEKKK